MYAFFKRRTVVVVLAALPVSVAIASPGDGPASYSHILPLGVDANQAVVQLRVPREVYLHARSPDLDDVRVFDADGASLPFALVDLAAPPVLSRQRIPVAVFPGSSTVALNLIASLTLSLLEPTVQAVAFFFHEKAWQRASVRRSAAAAGAAVDTTRQPAAAGA